jgi:hypothetical protein
VPPRLDRRWSLPPHRAGEDDDTPRLLALGALRPVLLDVVAPASARDTFTVRLQALRLVVPPALRAAGAVVCLDTALWLFAGGPAPGQVDLALPAGRARSRRAGLRAHQLGYGPADVWAPLPREPVTSPARTAADLACRRPTGEAVAALAVLGLATGLRPGQVHGVLADLAGRPGVRRARGAVQAWAELLPAPLPRPRSVDAVACDPVGVEHALDLADGVDHVVEVTGRRHLEGEARDRHPVP